MLPPVGWQRSSRTRSAAAIRRSCAVVEVVEVVAPGHHDFACVGLGGEPMPGQHLVFERGEERLRGGIIEARPDTAHRLPDPEPPTQRREMCCGVSGSAIGVEDHPVDWRAAPTYRDGHLDRIAGQRGVRMI